MIGFCIVTPNICGSSVQDLLHVCLLVPRAFVKASKFLEKFVHPWVKCFKKKKTELFTAETTFLDYQIFSNDIVLHSVSLQKIFM